MRKINDGLTSAQRYRRNHPGKVRAYALSEKAKKSCRESQRRSSYGEDAVRYYYSTLKAQKHRCAVCGKRFTRTASQDHNHKCCPTQKTCGECKRGLVCQSCNMGLFFAENSEWLKKAERYLRKWRAN